MRNKILIGVVLVLVALALAGCGGGKSGAVRAVEGLYTALAEKDDQAFAGYTCAEWEEQALLEYDSFQAVSTQLEDLDCRETGTEGEFTLIQCDGQIVASYENENMEFPLSDRVHKVRSESGDWRVCGY